MQNDDEAINGLDRRLLIRYLENLGWKTDRLLNRNIRLSLHEGSQSEAVEIFLSLDDQRSSKELFFAFNTLTQLYEKSASIIAAEIRALPYDVITGKIPSEQVKNDSIALRIASTYVSKMHGFLASSATTEISGGRIYKRVRKEGIEYADRCRFAHTFRGSFGFSIESPVGLNNEPTMSGIAQTMPLQRRVVARIARGLGIFSNAVAAQNPQLIVDAHNGFSANMCDIMADIVEDMELSKIEFEISFSREWPAPNGPLLSKKFDVERQYIDILRVASKSMRLNEEPRSADVFGRIKRLETDGNPSDLLEKTSSREIEINWIDEEEELTRVSLSLSPKEYLEAVEAHKKGDVVSASGVLVKKGRTWHLEQVQNFRVIQL